MTSNSSRMLRQIFEEARPLVEQALDLSAQFAAFRELATNNGLDWSQIKALLKAQVQDERAGDGSKRIDRIIEKADFAQAYADMLGLTDRANLNEYKNSAPPHDPSTGEIIETDAQHDGEVKQVSVAPAAIESPASSEEACPHASGEVQDRCESTSPPISTHDDFPDIPAFLDRRTAV